MADEISMHAILGHYGKWAVFALQDGSPLDHTAYDSRNDAVKAAKWDRDNYLYILIPPDGMTPKAARACITYARMLHDAGFRLPDPDSGIEIPTMPNLQQDWRRQISLLTKRN